MLYSERFGGQIFPSSYEKSKICRNLFGSGGFKCILKSSLCQVEIGYCKREISHFTLLYVYSQKLELQEILTVRPKTFFPLRVSIWYMN